MRRASVASGTGCGVYSVTKRGWVFPGLSVACPAVCACGVVRLRDRIAS
ncbi:DUF1317 family protein [Escherichia coli]